jgi:prepilin-type processing-associated H-X9-DG protein
MPIPFTCPHCGHQTTVADQFAGQTGPCVQCGKRVTVPGPPAAGGYAYAVPGKKSSSSTVLIVVLVAAVPALLVCSGILIALLLPAVQASREAARRASCANNLRQIGLALHTYQASYGCFPPAYIPDANGRPMHSWRVLILPYLEQQALYDQYRFDEPWDGPHNRALVARMPSIYRCPSDTGSDPSETSYLMIVGPDTISDGPTAHGLGDFSDGMSTTIAVIEAADRGVNWMEPQDLPVEIVERGIDRPKGRGLHSDHPGGVNAAFADGSVRFLSRGTDPDDLKAMSTIDGGEFIVLP